MIDENLPFRIIVNTAAIMGIPILKENKEVIRIIRNKLYESEFLDLTLVDFSDLAQECKACDELSKR